MSFFRKTESLTIDSHLDVDHKISARAKRLSLKVNFSTGRIELIIPKRASQRMIDQFLLSNQDWVLEKQAMIPKGVSFKDQATIPLFGQETRIHILKDASRKRTSVKLDDTSLFVTTNLDDPTPRIRRFLKEQAFEVYNDLIHPKASHIEKVVDSISIRDTKSRWGSCSHDGHISLSWRLIFAPYEAMDYVIAHEVAHLKHMDHSPAFWKTCESLCLDYKAGKFWMKENGHTLMRFGR